MSGTPTRWPRSSALVLPDDVSLTLVETWEDACDFVRWLGERRSALAVDTETTGVEFWRDRLRLVQFGDTRAGWAVPWDEWRGLIKRVFADYAGPLVLHNHKFDLHFLEGGGCDVRREQLNDTMTMAHLLEPTQRMGLKEVATRLVDKRSGAGQTELKRAFAQAKWGWDTVPVDFEGYWVYSALDVVLTAHLYDAMRPQITAGGFDEVYDLEMTCSAIVKDMEARGCRVDLEYCAAKKQELLDYATAARAWMDEAYSVGPSSGKKIAAALLADGVKLTKRTPSGGWSTDSEVLESLDHPLAESILKVRKAEKLANTYFGNYLTDADEGAIVHTTMKMLGARTGRMSSALHTLPRGKTVRQAFIAREGNMLVGADFGQIEARLLTHFSGDAALADAFNGEVDFFTAMARKIYNDPALQKEIEPGVGNPKRDTTKNAVYAKLYGGGIAQLAKTAGITEQESADFISMLDHAYPGIRGFQREIERVAKHRLMAEGEAYVRTVAGRKQVADKDYEYRLANYLIQGSAADIFKRVVVDLKSAGLADHLILLVHDEILLDVPADEAEDMARVLEQTMRQDKYAVPLVASANIARSWADLK